MSEPAALASLIAQAEKIVREHELLCRGVWDVEAPYCSCAPIGTPLCEACAALRDKIVVALATLLAARGPQREEEEDQTRVGPSVPCVAPTGSTAEKESGTVTAAERTEVSVCSWCDLSFYEAWPIITRKVEGKEISICQGCALELAEALSPGSVISE